MSFYQAATEKKQEMERVWTERQTDQEEIKSDSGSALLAILRVWLFGLREAAERGMTERNDGGMKARRGPLGGDAVIERIHHP